MNEISIRNAVPEDLAACHAIESACFPAAEAASRASIAQRIAEYPQGFLVAQVHGRVAAMINSGATHSEDITDEAFKKLIGHDPDGRNMVIFSLAVHPDFQGRGLARRLMERFTEASRRMAKHAVLLLCKDFHIQFYQHLGYSHGGESLSEHGGVAWHEMRYDLTGS